MQGLAVVMTIAEAIAIPGGVKRRGQQFPAGRWQPVVFQHHKPIGHLRRLVQRKNRDGPV